ncbi:DUF2231 domain-containing protein [Mycolicibacterium flavescens]|uniref:DUF2231 domain-containing protein n=1 Tax=Mycolicibacterium flavescens TaxID=1776 RepID=A0A1E3RLG5_MYCFV|nr:DUF2231 domain-containing protein [Mycolicibacterium flavescens]MCV7281924.1 DUF2231 domain-containing protein [Mycolicibacterium flavescens]ODQ90704.1 hypothetical protein BHQ18_08160 [Mycolicibacterium flavescens]
MSEQLEQAKEPVSRLLAGPYGHPFHPILVTVPIGAWVCSLVFDLASLVVDRPGFLTQGSQWLIGIGVIGAGAAAVIGLLDLVAIPSGTRAFRVGLLHMTLNLAVTAAYVAGFVWRHNTAGDDTAVSPGPLVLSLISVATLGLSGYLGGMLAYRYGVRVANESVQAEGYRKDR